MLQITHPDKVLYPKTGTTKIEIVNYYRQFIKYMLPFWENRPVSIVRCPEGVGGQRFYQKHPQEYFPEYIEAIKIHEKDKWDEYFYIDELADIEFLIQLNTLEFHIWGSKIKDIEHPDQIVFDLDPDPQADWKNVILAAQTLRDMISPLKSFVRTTGKKGLHVVVPINPHYKWDQIHDFAHQIAQDLEQSAPDKFTTTLPKDKRTGKVFIDYLRNTRGATAIANFSTRIFERPTVAMPLDWDEIAHVRPDQFDINNAHERITKDLWKDFLTTKQELKFSK